MRNGSPLARAGRAVQRTAADRRLHACPPPRSGVPEASPDRLNRQLADRIPRMERHHRAVAEMAGTVARHIGLDGERLHAVVRAAELHDVGKVLVPDEILNKPGALSEDELALMRRHAVAGYVILHRSSEPAPIAALVRSSHERWDGTGYPDGLRGEAIPLGARIITICDAYDAMTHDRPYRPARTVAEALDELRLGAGVRYDPTLVAVFTATVGASAYRETRATQ
jgi:HD-GYP domain-containing protein (c-di-GMP phosphodiesterase class II)